MKKNYLLLIFFVCSSFLWAQEKTVTGTVTDEQGIPLAGANILVQNTTNGTQADFDGKYSIQVAEGQVLVVSYVGYTTQSITVGTASVIDVSLQEDAAQLDEVVVVGYGTQKVVDLTGSVSVVKGGEVARQPVFQTSQALAGLVPGLTVDQNSGQPGSDGGTIRIRGLGTLGNGNKSNPLILVDGVADGLNGVDANDIESISVLKDASAASIYGSRAANGVIIITTKRGKSGKLQATYTTNIGFQSPTENLKFLDALGYMEAFNAAEPGSFDQALIDAYRTGPNGTDERPDTDWVDLLFSESGFQQYHQLGIRGGSETAQVSASISFQEQEGNIKGFGFKRYNGRLNTDLKVTDKLKVSFDLNFRRTEDRRPGLGLNEITQQAYRIQPLFQAINDDGSWGPGWNGQNPLAQVNAGGFDDRNFNYFRGVFKAVYKPIESEDLTLAFTYSPQYNDNDRKRFIRQYEYKGNSTAPIDQFPNENSLFQSTTEGFTDNINLVLTYVKDFGNHNVEAIFGYESIENKTNSFNATRRNFVLQGFPELNLGDVDTQENRGGSDLYALESVFGRINYNYKGKYLFQASLRRDESSRFAAGNRTGYFPSFSAGWRISEEDFFPKDGLVSNLKLRASWGQLGNQELYDSDGDILNFPYTSLFDIGGSNAVIGTSSFVGASQNVLGNPLLQWESSETTNFALDATLFDNRLSLTAEYYIRKTLDILLPTNANVPDSAGFGLPQQNAGEVENKGWDLQMGWNDRIGDDFTYGINFNISDYKNSVTNLNGLDELPPGNTISRLGNPIGAIYGLQVLGLYQESDFTGGTLNAGNPVPQFGAVAPGDFRYADLNEDGIVNNDDRTILGSNLPRLNWGVNLSAEYKGVDFAVSFIGVGDRDVVLSGDAAYAFNNAGKIQEWQTDYWTPQNTDASYPRLTPGSSHSNWRTNSAWTFDASYFRMRNLTIGYSLPDTLLEKINLGGLRFYVSGQNLFTSDNMPDGIDPEIGNFAGTAIYPLTKVYTFGLNVTF